MQNLACCLVACAVAFLGLSLIRAAEPEQLSEELKVFEPVIGKTFRGEFAGSTPEKPTIDIARWERALNGKGVRILHSVNDGVYGGETIIMWDPSQKKIAFWYFTTAGFHTEGTVEVDGKKWTTHEKVVGNEHGITEVKATTELTDDGKMIVDAEYMSEGKWTHGRHVTYTPAPKELVRFK